MLPHRKTNGAVRKSMDLVEMMEGIENLTDGRMEFDEASWMALALSQIDAGTYDANEWVFVESLGFRVLKPELPRLER
jgi:hypothetical protein